MHSYYYYHGYYCYHNCCNTTAVWPQKHLSDFQKEIPEIHFLVKVNSQLVLKQLLFGCLSNTAEWSRPPLSEALWDPLHMPGAQRNLETPTEHGLKILTFRGGRMNAERGLSFLAMHITGQKSMGIKVPSSEVRRPGVKIFHPMLKHYNSCFQCNSGKAGEHNKTWGSDIYTTSLIKHLFPRASERNGYTETSQNCSWYPKKMANQMSRSSNYFYPVLCSNTTSIVKTCPLH